LAVSKVAEVVSLLHFNSSVYFSLHITKAKSRNKQLGYYEGNWPTYEILKRFFKSKRYYMKHITFMEDNDDSDSEGNNAMLSDNNDGEGGSHGD
jgi:hypothetical protein